MPIPKTPIPLDYAESTKQFRRRVMIRRIAKILIILGIGVIVVSIPMTMYWRAQANQYLCAQNMREIYNALLIYSNENLGQRPPDWSTLAKSENVSPAVFVCPSSSDTPAQGSTPELALAEMTKPGHVSYILTQFKPITFYTPADTVILYETCSHLDGIHVLLVDGSVMQLNAAQTKQFMANLAAGNPRFLPPLDLPTTQR